MIKYLYEELEHAFNHGIAAIIVPALICSFIISMASAILIMFFPFLLCFIVPIPFYLLFKNVAVYAKKRNKRSSGEL